MSVEFRGVGTAFTTGIKHHEEAELTHWEKTFEWNLPQVLLKLQEVEPEPPYSLLTEKLQTSSF